MDPKNKEASQVHSSEQVRLPDDVLLYFSKFVNFQDFRSFIRFIWPNGDESDVIQEQLVKKSTHTYEATFFNGKIFKIIYNFDPERYEAERVLVRSDSLKPIFGGIVIPQIQKFSCVLKLYNWVFMYIHLNRCSEYEYASCICHAPKSIEELPREFENECDYGHMHHYCWEHVYLWIVYYLHGVILLRESKQFFNDRVAELWSDYPEQIEYFQTGSRATPEFLLKAALDKVAFFK